MEEITQLTMLPFYKSTVPIYVRRKERYNVHKSSVDPNERDFN